MYEIYCKLRDFYGYKDSDVAKGAGITKSTFSDWKSGRSKPKPDKMQRIADFFGVSIDFLLGSADFTICPICYNKYDPLNQSDSYEHDVFHMKFVYAQELFGKILQYSEADRLISDSIRNFRNPSLSLSEKIQNFDDYLKYSFMISIWKHNFDLNHDDFKTYCKKEVGLVSTKEALDEIDPSFYQKVVEKYGVIKDDISKDVNPINNDTEQSYKAKVDTLQLLKPSDNGLVGAVFSKIEYNDDELAQIKRFAQYLKSIRKK